MDMSETWAQRLGSSKGIRVMRESHVQNRPLCNGMAVQTRGRCSCIGLREGTGWSIIQTAKSPKLVTAYTGFAAFL